MPSVLRMRFSVWTPVKLGRGITHVRFRMRRGGPKDQVLWIDDVRLVPAR